MYETGAQGGILGMMWLIWIGAYLFYSFCQYRIAVKANHQSPWQAWIPIVQTFQLINIAGKEWWWFLLFLIPIVNIFAIAVVWMECSKAIGQPSFWGILMLVPFINFVALLYLAFSSGTAPRPAFQAPQRQNQPYEKIPQ